MLHEVREGPRGVRILGAEKAPAEWCTARRLAEAGEANRFTDRSSFLTARTAGIVVRASDIEDDDGRGGRRPPDARSNGAAKESRNGALSCSPTLVTANQNRAATLDALSGLDCE
jgi:hypothetical protein